MKNYTETNKEAFIKKYKIKGDKLIVTYANHKQRKLPINQEQEIISTMENQVRTFYHKSDTIEKKLKRNMLIILISAILDIYLKLHFYMNDFLFLTTTLVLSYATVKEIKRIKILEDINKHNIYLDNKNYLNENINKNMLKHLSLKTKYRITKKLNRNERVFNINNISMYSLKDMQKISENINENIINKTKIKSK